MRPSASSSRMEASERITAARLLAAGVAATARLAGDPAADRGEADAFPGDPAVEEPLDEVDLVADGVVPPDLALHGLGRAAAVKGDHRVPAARGGGGQVLHEAGDLEAGGGGDAGPPAEDGLQGGGRLGVVVLVGAGEGDDETAGDVVGQAVHVVDLGGQ